MSFCLMLIISGSAAAAVQRRTLKHCLLCPNAALRMNISPEKIEFIRRCLREASIRYVPPKAAEEASEGTFSHVIKPARVRVADPVLRRSLNTI